MVPLFLFCFFVQNFFLKNFSKYFDQKGKFACKTRISGPLSPDCECVFCSATHNDTV